MGVSRFRTRKGVYLYGRLRRTDFLPVGDEQEEEVLERGYGSVSSEDSECGSGLEYAFPDGSSSDEEGYLGMGLCTGDVSQACRDYE